jgi:hypothetical protein
MGNIDKQNLSIYNAFIKISELYRNGYLPLIDGIITREKYIKQYRKSIQ